MVKTTLIRCSLSIIIRVQVSQTLQRHPSKCDRRGGILPAPLILTPPITPLPYKHLVLDYSIQGAYGLTRSICNIPTHANTFRFLGIMKSETRQAGEGKVPKKKVSSWLKPFSTFERLPHIRWRGRLEFVYLITTAAARRRGVDWAEPPWLYEMITLGSPVRFHDAMPHSWPVNQQIYICILFCLYLYLFVFVCICICLYAWWFYWRVLWHFMM